MKIELAALLRTGLLPALGAASRWLALSRLRSEQPNTLGAASVLPPGHFWERAATWDSGERWREQDRPPLAQRVSSSSPHTPALCWEPVGPSTLHIASVPNSDSVHFAEIHEEQLCHHFFCTITERQSAPKATTASPSAPRGSLCQKSSFALGCVEGISAICPSFLFPLLHFSDQRVTPPARSAPRIPAVPGVGTARTVASRQAELLPRRCGGSERRSPPPRPSGPGPTLCPLRIRPRPSQGNVCSARSSALPVGGEKRVGLCASWQSAGRRFCSGCGL